MRKLILFLYVVQMLVSISMIWIGCAGRKIPPPRPAPKFWSHCEEQVPAKPDDFQHFVCLDVKNRQWEVLVRREGK